MRRFLTAATLAGGLWLGAAASAQAGVTIIVVTSAGMGLSGSGTNTIDVGAALDGLHAKSGTLSVTAFRQPGNTYTIEATLDQVDIVDEYTTNEYSSVHGILSASELRITTGGSTATTRGSSYQTDYPDNGYQLFDSFPTHYTTHVSEFGETIYDGHYVNQYRKRSYDITYQGYTTLDLDLSADALAQLNHTHALGYDYVAANDYAGFWILDDATLTLTAGVPEPASWALLIGGFGGVGAMLRRRRTLAAA